MPVKKYTQLSKGSKDKLSTTLERLHKSGITRKEALLMSDYDLKMALGFKGKKASFEALKRNIRQVGHGVSKTDTITRKEGISNLLLPKYVKFGYRGKKLNIVKTEIRKASGLNIFFDIAKKVQSTFNVSQKDSWNETRAILELAKVNYNALTKREKKILSYFS